jgi:hypothetical protein
MGLIPPAGHIKWEEIFNVSPLERAISDYILQYLQLQLFPPNCDKQMYLSPHRYICYVTVQKYVVTELNFGILSLFSHLF